MKRVTITLEFNNDDSQYIDEHGGGCDIGLLLRDALGEFEAVRLRLNFASNAAAFKIRDVQKRTKMAQALRRGDVTILVQEDGNETPHGSETICPVPTPLTMGTK